MTEEGKRGVYAVIGIVVGMLFWAAVCKGDIASFEAEGYGLRLALQGAQQEKLGALAAVNAVSELHKNEVVKFHVEP